MMTNWGKKHQARRAFILAILLLIGCTTPAQPPWSDVKARLVGKPYEELVACAGVPDGLTTVGEGTGAVLYREYAYRPTSTCEATLMVKNGHIVSVTQREIDESTTYSSVAWPNYKLCSKRFENCPWTR